MSYFTYTCEIVLNRLWRATLIILLFNLLQRELLIWRNLLEKIKYFFNHCCCNGNDSIIKFFKGVVNMPPISWRVYTVYMNLKCQRLYTLKVMGSFVCIVTKMHQDSLSIFHKVFRIEFVFFLLCNIGTYVSSEKFFNQGPENGKNNILFIVVSQVYQ